MKKFKSNFYTKEKIVCRDHQHRYIEDEDGYLFAQGIYPTKIKTEDLPEWYVYGRYYKCFGYFSAKGVADLKYIPSKYSNHFLKDDFLFISYNAPIIENPGTNSFSNKYTGYDERIYGNEILDFVKAAKQYSDYDISGIVQQIQNKADWLPQEFPDEFGDFKFDAKAFFNEQGE